MSHRWTIGVVDVHVHVGERLGVVRRGAFLLEGTAWSVHRAMPGDNPNGEGVWVVAAGGRAMPRSDRTGRLLLGSHRAARGLVELLVDRGLKDPERVRRPDQLAKVFRVVDAHLAGAL